VELQPPQQRQQQPEALEDSDLEDEGVPTPADAGARIAKSPGDSSGGVKQRRAGGARRRAAFDDEEEEEEEKEEEEEVHSQGSD
jgi:hypothetical protein